MIQPDTARSLNKKSTLLNKLPEGSTATSWLKKVECLRKMRCNPYIPRFVWSLIFLSLTYAAFIFYVLYLKRNPYALTISDLSPDASGTIGSLQLQNISYCSVLLTRNYSRSSSQIWVELESSSIFNIGTPLSYAGGVLQQVRKFQPTEGCTITVQIPVALRSIGSFALSCSADCALQSNVDDLSFGSLEIQGGANYSKVAFTKASTTNLTVAGAQMFVDFRSLAVANLAQVDIKQGTFLMNTDRDLTVQFNTNQSLCLDASNIAISTTSLYSDFLCELANSSNFRDQSTLFHPSCAGEVTLCRLPVCNATRGLVRVQVESGGIYIHQKPISLPAKFIASSTFNQVTELICCLGRRENEGSLRRRSIKFILS